MATRLFLCASTTAISDDTRLMRMEHDGHSESPASGEILYTYKKEQSSNAAPAPPAGDVQMAFEVDSAAVPPRIPVETMSKKELFPTPTGPCLWVLEIAHTTNSNKDTPQTWRTVQVNGSQNEHFYFDGCTTEGTEASYCLAKKSSGGVRLLRSGAGHIVDFGSCCDPQVVDSVAAARIMHCAPRTPVTTAAPPHAINATEYPGIAHMVWKMAHESPWLPSSSNLLLETLVIAGVVAMALIGRIMWGRFKITRKEIPNTLSSDAN